MGCDVLIRDFLPRSGLFKWYHCMILFGVGRQPALSLIGLAAGQQIISAAKFSNSYLEYPSIEPLN